MRTRGRMRSFRLEKAGLIMPGLFFDTPLLYKAHKLACSPATAASSDEA
jgi:hypothetical protein